MTEPNDPGEPVTADAPSTDEGNDRDPDDGAEGGMSAPGTGGITLGPPPPRGRDADDIGFAPDLDDDPRAPAFEVPEKSFDPLTTATAPDEAAPSGGVSGRRAEGRAHGRAARRSRPAGYPLAEAALDRLLGGAALEPAGASPSAEQDEWELGAADVLGIDAPPPTPAEDQGDVEELSSFSVLPSVTRRPVDVRRPPPEPTEDPSAQRTERQIDEMVDMVLVGGDDDGPPSVHLMLKDEVFGGLYVLLEQREEGVFARFQVKDASTRRAVEGRVAELLTRLRDKGLRVAGHEVVLESA